LRREDYGPADIARWSEMLRANANKWRDAFVYFKHEEQGIGPKLATQLMQSLFPATTQ
jgi:uncharacterized protein YecE (DUF72 family)